MKRLPVVDGLSARHYEAQTQDYSTWGGKLLQHTDVLHAIQKDRRFHPITVQLAPTEACDSDCPFCSVSNRPVNKRIPWSAIEDGLRAFRDLGAKSVEITGGGNPLLYRDGDRDINDIVTLAHGLGLRIGVITNSERPAKHLTAESAARLDWIRVSLIKLDEGKTPSDFDLSGFRDGSVGFSYIIYEGTTRASIEKIADLVDRTPAVKFVRIAADCLTDDSLTIKRDWGDVVAALDVYGKFFIKEINDTYHPYESGCWVGALRPYWVHDGVYICTSHVLKHRTYHPTWKLCDHGGIRRAWALMSARLARGEPPYRIEIASECWHCYYYNNNRLLHDVIREMPDKDFA